MCCYFCSSLSVSSIYSKRMQMKISMKLFITLGNYYLFIILSFHHKTDKNSPDNSIPSPQEQCLAAKLFRLIVAPQPRRGYHLSRLISNWKWQIVPKAVVILFIIVDIAFAADAAYKIKFVTFRRGSKFKRYDINSIVLNGHDSFKAMGIVNCIHI